MDYHSQLTEREREKKRLTSSPLSPLLPFCPGPPTSPCGAIQTAELTSLLCTLKGSHVLSVHVSQSVTFTTIEQ